MPYCRRSELSKARSRKPLLILDIPTSRQVLSLVDSAGCLIHLGCLQQKINNNRSQWRSSIKNYFVIKCMEYGIPYSYCIVHMEYGVSYSYSCLVCDALGFVGVGGSGILGYYNETVHSALEHRPINRTSHLWLYIFCNQKTKLILNCLIL